MLRSTQGVYLFLTLDARGLTDRVLVVVMQAGIIKNRSLSSLWVYRHHLLHVELVNRLEVLSIDV